MLPTSSQGAVARDKLVVSGRKKQIVEWKKKAQLCSC
jgi:hypothetical protein